MKVCFELSMPNAGSWNGNWSGEGNLYCIIRTMLTPPRFGNYYYNFEDGWGANITVREVTSAAARKMQKMSRGFLGYDWMVNDIVRHGRILTPEERHPEKVTA